MLLKQPNIAYGVVEDINDPLKACRCRVRLFNFHNEKKEAAGPKGIPTEDLPWALPMIPTTDGLMSGIGVSPTRIKNGTEVICLVRDDKYQDLVILGIVPGVPQEPADPNIGFEDPDGVYPLVDRLEEPDTNRLARKEKLDKTILENKSARVLKDVPMVGGGSWSEPLPIDYIAPEYPYNQVEETESGHVIEKDDTPGFERISTWHKSGAFDDVTPSGERIIKIPNNFYLVIEDGEILVYSGKGISFTAKQDITFLTEGAIALKANNGVQIDSVADIDIQSNGRASINGQTVSINR